MRATEKEIKANDPAAGVESSQNIKKGVQGNEGGGKTGWRGNSSENGYCRYIGKERLVWSRRKQS